MYFKLLLIKLCRQFKYLNVYLRKSQNHKYMAAFLSIQQVFIKHPLFVRPTLGAETPGKPHKEAPAILECTLQGWEPEVDRQADAEEFQIWEVLKKVKPGF